KEARAAVEQTDKFVIQLRKLHLIENPLLQRELGLQNLERDLGLQITRDLELALKLNADYKQAVRELSALTEEAVTYWKDEFKRSFDYTDLKIRLQKLLNIKVTLPKTKLLHQELENLLEEIKLKEGKKKSNINKALPGLQEMLRKARKLLGKQSKQDSSFKKGLLSRLGDFIVGPLYAEEPDLDALMEKANDCKIRREYTDALIYYKQALELAQDNETKTNIRSWIDHCQKMGGRLQYPVRSKSNLPVTQGQVAQEIREKGYQQYPIKELPSVLEAKSEASKVIKFTFKSEEAKQGLTKLNELLPEEGHLRAGPYSLFYGAVYENTLYLDTLILNNPRQLTLTILYAVGSLMDQPQKENPQLKKVEPQVTPKASRETTIVTRQEDITIEQLEVLLWVILGGIPLKRVQAWAENHAIFQRTRPVALNGINFEHDPDLISLKRAFSEGLLREIDIEYPKNNIKLHAWFLQPKNNMPTVIYSYGRGSNLSDGKYLMDSFARRGFGFLGWSYPGYEYSEGYPSEQSLYEGLNAVSNYLVFAHGIQPCNQIAMGHSLGGLVTINAATKIPFRLTVIISTIPSVSDYYEYSIKRVPLVIRRMCVPAEKITQRFDALSKVPFVKSPVLFIYGDKDEEVPLDIARKLFSLSKTPSYEYIINDAPHNLEEIPKFAEEICKITHSYQSHQTAASAEERSEPAVKAEEAQINNYKEAVVYYKGWLKSHPGASLSHQFKICDTLARLYIEIDKFQGVTEGYEEFLRDVVPESIKNYYIDHKKVIGAQPLSEFINILEFTEKVNQNLGKTFKLPEIRKSTERIEKKRLIEVKPTPSVDRETVSDVYPALEVREGYFGITRPGDKRIPYLQTSGVFECIALTLYDPSTKTGLVAHFTSFCDVPGSFNKMLAMLKQEGVDTSNLEARVIGGQAELSLSSELALNILDELKENNILIKEKDILGSILIAIMIDTNTGEIYNYIENERLINAPGLQSYNQEFKKNPSSSKGLLSYVRDFFTGTAYGADTIKTTPELIENYQKSIMLYTEILNEAKQLGMTKIPLNGKVLTLIELEAKLKASKETLEKLIALPQEFNAAQTDFSFGNFKRARELYQNVLDAAKGLPVTEENYPQRAEARLAEIKAIETTQLEYLNKTLPVIESTLQYLKDAFNQTTLKEARAAVEQTDKFIIQLRKLHLIENPFLQRELGLQNLERDLGLQLTRDTELAIKLNADYKQAVIELSALTEEAVTYWKEEFKRSFDYTDLKIRLQKLLNIKVTLSKTKLLHQELENLLEEIKLKEGK
ncbi:MAG: alpha/beta hydrolase, partial [Candidatus Omnitrophota bacterium]